MRTTTSTPPTEGSRPLACPDATLRVGHFCLDVPNRRLHCLNETARQLRREGLPLTGDDPAHASLRTLDGAPVLVERLPLVVASRTGHAVETVLVLPLPGQPDLHLHWSATPLKDDAGKVRSVLGAVVCRPPAPDWEALAGAAHDLATPLHTIGLLLNVLARSPDRAPAGPVAEAVTRLRSAGQRAQQIGRDLVEWCRTAGLRGRTARLSWFPLEPFLGELAGEQQPSAEQKGLGLTFTPGSVRGWEINSDPVWLGRIIANLLVNAIRYTPAGGRVQLGADWENRPAGRVLTLAVADTGVGISLEEQESIFQPFEQGQTGRESGSLGSGIGLAVVDQLAQQLGFQRELASQHGLGSVFRLLIPANYLRKPT